MKFIPPLEISAKIMTLIEEAENEIILVSPYVSISSWKKMQNCLRRAVERKVKIAFYARKNADQDLSFIKNIGIDLILVKDLHAKVYLNENYGIVTSQNISEYADSNSIDIGYQTETSMEKDEVFAFVKKYVQQKENINKSSIIEKVKSENIKTELSPSELNFLHKSLQNNFPNAKLTKTSTYVFCGNILPFGDVMIDREMTIKIKKTHYNFIEIVNKLELINYDPNPDLVSTNKITTHKTFYYLTFIPARTFTFESTVVIFLRILKNILTIS